MAMPQRINTNEELKLLNALLERVGCPCRKAEVCPCGKIGG